MKSAFATFLIFSLLGVAVLGFLAMNHGDGHSGCIAAVANGVDCAREIGRVGLFSFHSDAFRSFSLATLLGLTLFVLALLFSFNFKMPLPALYLKWHNPKTLSLPQKSLLIRWLALHENSPSFS
ncbi:hypothetical protein A3B05_03250 [Candidatus Giovannonibacteria bacterium RIFCSPLOWO2_01_FULL_43_160]|uniref:Uncharacterized protein n=1 Tax=Candidatus Giovannonibacteria bacterium RIFCSPLOWO2_12_FULL_43_26 TaxID=1798363 RepID=A0A1F5XVB3_9BACT|nr:MAG: hypothetical protein A2652_03180 [Candidatus Giovannonibacteria bacterium RIFCSPHIGHO2_01_FULL_43_140]OGF70676.1 MAG: hypothetical protein A3C76_01685 [Candidatus Giovannonibacteria bacterium RIFCSPHIGHO2_02_FULL_44_51]OGF72435.1 MAG: hypothetical protein A3E35_02580 [Candidatus Giovannonibacteria bacterium RIFCSPHIGHO2_12_FULL_44_22]OGF76088.1 MAG: hypothetical protein A3B05_03250 [Candidatus Giovannonibacteria bacterium RIFCSPLOWO2_01_FULL_43_160]OGF85734.1 MAG: hypothetical protein A